MLLFLFYLIKLAATIGDAQKYSRKQPRMEPLLEKRTHTCGELNVTHENMTVTLQGWVHRRRDHGSLIFIDLRDIHGLTQVVFDPNDAGKDYAKARELRPEYVVGITGVVRRRPEGMVNPNLATGAIEVRVTGCKIYNRAKTPPFLIVDQVDATEELRFQYRYLDLRRPEMQQSLRLRHRAAQVIRSYLNSQHFMEIETPYLMRSTPEGARDFLVPSRLHAGKFYALPQSPQTYKQILMVAGYDRYYQFVRCFRDEDLRADRQPEFTQVDIEMSFVDEQDIFRIADGIMEQLFLTLFQWQLPRPTPVLSYQESLRRFGTDKPDLRFGMEITDVSELVAGSEFKLFSETVQAQGLVAGINFKAGAGYSRKQIDNLNQFIMTLGGKGVLAAKVTPEGWEASFAKFLSREIIEQINRLLNAAPGDLLLFMAGDKLKTLELLGKLRLKIAMDERLIAENEFRLVWITDFPLVEYDPEAGRYVAVHHPFTSPRVEDLPLLESHPLQVRARAYDLVLNGYELAGGSIRNHQYETQMRIFKLLNISDAEAEDTFGFLLNALQYGAPPHGGIAFGFDRLVMILAGKTSIRDVIAFPKTTSALSLMDNAPAAVDERQLQELHLKIVSAEPQAD